MSLINELIKSAKLAKQGKKVIVNPKPFFSAVDKAALDLQRAKGTGKEFMTELKKTKGIKPAEIENRKLAQIEEMPKMTKDQFIDELEKRPPADLKERTLIEESEKNKEFLAGEQYGVSFDDLRADEEEAVLSQLVKYGDYKLPGGENYREILLQLPTFGGKDLEDLMYLEAMERRGGIGTEYGEQRLAMLRKKRDEMGQPYMTPHFENEPNTLAHMRVQDRLEEQPPEMRYVAFNKNSGFPSPDFATPEELDAYIKTLPPSIQNSLVVKQTQVAKPPRKILHVEEIQSDWHQMGRERGYGSMTPEEKDEMRYLSKDTRDSEDDARLDELLKKSNQVQDAPFKKNWHELAMKRLLNYASENGYDGIAITPGAEQAKRYDLSKQVDELLYKKNPDGTYQLSAQAQGRGNMMGEAIPANKLEDYVGKEVAKKIIEGEGKTTEVAGKYNPESMTSSKDHMQSLSGVDLQIGGEGMAGFYDKMIPDYLNTFGKKYGVQTEMGGYKLKGDPSLRGDASERLGLAGQRFADMTPEEIEAFNAKLDDANAKQLHYFKITPEMREEVKQGMPLYQQVGVPIGAGAAGAEIEVPQPVQEEEPAFAMGGAVYNTNPDMRDGGQIIQGDAFKRGGKVHIAGNPDTMFMELHDKKLAGGGLLKKALQVAKPAIKGMQETLPIAEREANKAKFLGSSKVKQPVYHGTMSNVQRFKTPAYFGNKDVANQFADPEYLFASSELNEGEHPNVMPVHLGLRKPKIFKTEEDYEKHVMEGGLDVDKWKKKGYDSVIYAPEGDMSHEDAYFVAFEPEQVKSAIGNRGTYDPAEPDLTKRKGGLINIKRK